MEWPHISGNSFTQKTSGEISLLGTRLLSH